MSHDPTSQHRSGASIGLDLANRVLQSGPRTKVHPVVTGTGVKPAIASLIEQLRSPPSSASVSVKAVVFAERSMFETWKEAMARFSPEVTVRVATTRQAVTDSIGADGSSLTIVPYRLADQQTAEILRAARLAIVVADEYKPLQENPDPVRLKRLQTLVESVDATHSALLMPVVGFGVPKQPEGLSGF